MSREPKPRPGKRRQSLGPVMVKGRIQQGHALWNAATPVRPIPPPFTDEEKRARRGPPSAAARARVEAFLRDGTPPVVTDPDEAAGLSPSSYKFALGRSAVAGGIPPREPGQDAKVLRELAVDFGRPRR